MTTIRAGNLWIADIPFTNGAASKKRPVLILWIDGRDVVVAAVISAHPRRANRDVVLTDWAASGLRVASTVRLSRLDSLENSLLIARLGHLSNRDAEKIKEVWKLHIKPQF